MAAAAYPIISNLVHETSTTTGTGNFTLSNVNGKQSFNTAFGNGATTDVFWYFISNRDAAEWEVGTGHMSAASTLVRDTIIASTNSNAAVNFSAGTKDVTNNVPANRGKRGGPVNIIPMGSFDIWQRGAGNSASIAVAASTTAYTADRWYLTTGANQASTVAAAAGIATGSYKAAKVQRNNGQTGTGTMRFAIPLDLSCAAQIAGSYVCVSFTAKSGANWSPTSGTLTWALYCGTTATAAKRNASSYTGETTPISTSSNLTTTATRYQATSSAALGTTVAQAELQFNWAPTGTAGADDSFTIDDVQIEIVAGATSTASDFEFVAIAQQFAHAQRHYWKSYSYDVAPATSLGSSPGSQKLFWACSSGTQWGFPFLLPTRMRSTPTLTAYDSAGTADRCDIYSGGWSAGNTFAVSPAGVDSNFFFQITSSTAAGIGFNIVADASI